MNHSAKPNRQQEGVIQNTISPADGSVVATVTMATPEVIQQTLDKANVAQQIWKQVPLAQRQDYCSRAIDALLSHRDMIASELSWMMGRPIRHSSSELRGVEERARYMIKHSEQALATIKLPEKKGFTRYISREPLGTVLVISPWNYPYLTAINSIIPALLAGNSVILKPSSHTPLCAQRFQQAFDEAQLPEGIFQHLFLSHDATEDTVSSEQIQHVVFTGSVTGGANVEIAAAGHFHGLGLELGGNDPAYVCNDADINLTVDAIVDGALYNAGQSCCAIERIYVDYRVHDEFVEKAIQRVNQYQLGFPLDEDTTLGPLISVSAADHVRQQITEAKHQGAQTHISEVCFPNSKPGTPYLAPQLLTNVNHQMRIMTEETFGPVLPIQKVYSDHEAVDLMNDSEYGLTACIFTSNINRAISIGEQVETGTFFANRCDYLDPALAWTGVKHSGKGYALSTLGFETLTRPKSFHLKHPTE
ncbi:aldehyde dehydrogenase family protein [Photobacterium sp. DNB23_23_1]|uniref:Aldehyde dehydrogenase family protein n=1 Tax=Photobacterium pectinilyticum TaxID=2906793 RepID=A0ABT1N4X2_9GAMM|nr:aldehyde dehydrogenase family protein [Photobacterium sp. ZSDE20]MCQ1059773.1 aldehyde dehydrogenase family protein [Photobacterium sp. ZSDE20]MDD1826008.1 aldehyde dehydrogenase family protein [Photobacterium sp. ZSDE20]